MATNSCFGLRPQYFNGVACEGCFTKKKSPGGKF